MTNIFDIDIKAESEKGAFLHLKHPGTDEPLYVTNGDGTEDKEKPIGLTLAGADSQSFKRAAALNTAKNAKRRDVDLTKADPDEIMKLVAHGESIGIDLIVAVTKKLHNITMGGETLKSTKDEIRRLYESQPWVKEQADAFFSDRANYLGNAPKP